MTRPGVRMSPDYMSTREQRLRTRIDQLTDERDYFRDRYQDLRARNSKHRELARDRGISAEIWKRRYFDLRRSKQLRVA